MRILKLITFSILFLILLLPASCSTWWSVNEVLGKNTYVNPAYKESPFYTTDDEIGFMITVNPRTKPILAIFEPITLPIVMPDAFSNPNHSFIKFYS